MTDDQLAALAPALRAAVDAGNAYDCYQIVVSVPEADRDRLADLVTADEAETPST